MNFTGDAGSFTDGVRQARAVAAALSDAISEIMRPRCPHCQRLVATIGTRPDGVKRIRYLGCRLCHYRVKGTEVIDIANTGHRSSNYQRNQTGRFISSR